MIATINTDASYREGCGGYAFWIVSNQGRIQKAGELRGIVVHAQDAELRCIANALHTLKHSLWINVTRIIINTDSLWCIGKLLGTSGTSHNPVVRQDITRTILLMAELPAPIEFRHVKAHSGVRDARSVVNAWCDAQAKIYCRQVFDREGVRL